MNENAGNAAMAEGASQGKHFPAKRLALSVLAAAAAFALFYSCYFLFAPRAMPGMTDYAGTYTLADVSHGDITLAELNGLPSATVELDANGRCRLYVGGQSLSGHWTLNGNSAELYCAWKKFTGIFSENKLALRSNDSNSAALLFMLGSTKDDGGSIPTGKYKLIAIDDNGTAYTGSVIDASEPVAWYISIKRDGSGSAAVFSEEADEISVDSRYIILRGMRLAYTLDGDALTLEYPGGIKLTFEK